MQDFKKIVLNPYDNSSYDILRISHVFDNAEKIFYEDEQNGFKLEVPKWFYIRETNNLNVFGGTLPVIDSVENAIMINSYKKDKFSSFTDFRIYIIEDSTYVKGTTPKYSTNHIFNSIEITERNNFEF